MSNDLDTFSAEPGGRLVTSAAITSAWRAASLPVLLGALCFFSILSSYYMLRPIRAQFAAAAGGSQVMPMLYGVVFVCMLVATPLYGALVSRYPRRVFVPIVYAFFALCLLGLEPFFSLGLSTELSAQIFFVWVSVFSLFVVSVFWSCMSDVFSELQAKNWFGMIALGGTAGAIAGPALARAIVQPLGAGALYTVASCALFVALGCLLVLFKWSALDKPLIQQRNSGGIGGSIFAGASAVFANPFLRRMALLMLCADAVGTVLAAILSDYSRVAFPERNSGIRFFATIDLATNCLQLLSQAFLVRWMLHTLGPGKTIAIPNLLSITVLLSLAVLQVPALIAVALVITRGGGYGLVAPARESLFTRVSREARFKAKGFIDTAVWRGGDLLMVSAVAIMVDQGAGIAAFGVFSAVGALVAVLLAWRIEYLLPAQAQLGDDAQQSNLKI